MLNSQEKSFVDSAIEKFGTDIVTKKQLLEHQQEFGVGKYFGQDLSTRVGRGLYKLPSSEQDTATTVAKTEVAEDTTAQAALMPAPKKSLTMDHNGFSENLIPAVDPLFVAFGNYHEFYISVPYINWKLFKKSEIIKIQTTKGTLALDGERRLEFSDKNKACLLYTSPSPRD